ncbi:hypothetical protein BSKO_07360 [Bryopsis sp. KO-2023]|nr:hypothetical protein BSKO_07360 [Bryopsis sp. KO-2023]
MQADDVETILIHHPRYKVLKVLGNGTFGTVALCQDTFYQDDEKKAIKIVSNTSKYIYKEIINHRKLRHPHVIQFRRLLELRGQVGIVMEFADGGNLFDYVKQRRRLEETLARWFFQQLILAVDYCHRKGVVNRDIKLENLLLQNDQLFPQLKLCDFGYSKNDDDSLPKSMVGSPNYMAPEVLSFQRYDATLSDIWSCGVVLYVMVVGRYPFHMDHNDDLTSDEWREAIMNKIKTLDYNIPSFLTPECRNLIRKILVGFEERASMSDILNDPWFSMNMTEGARTMNDKSLARDAEFMGQMEKVQSTKEIERLISSSMNRGYRF